MSTNKAHVQNGILQASESCDAPVQVGSAQWFQWLETATQFAFQGQYGKFHARKEKASNGRGTTYWRAYHRLNGQLKRVYLGKNEAVTLAQCEQAAQILSTPMRASIQTPDRRLSQPVLVSRFRTPHINYKKIRRPHIEHLLNDSLRVKLTLVLAPAGYGKTDALTQWTETSSHSVVWVSLEKDDDSAAQFWTKILLAVSERIASTGVNEPPLHTREAGLLLTRLISLLTDLAQEIVLILDNYHHITKPEIQQQFDYWFSQLPINVHVIVSTRSEPAIALAQLRVANQLRVIDHITLRWSEEETSHFIHKVTLAEATLRTIKVPQKRGRPRTRPQELVTDTAYDSRQLQHVLLQRGIKVTIPTFERRKRKKPRRGRPIKVGPSYQSRWKVERCFGWMDNCRRLVVRYDRYLYIYRSFCLLALMLWSIDRILK